MSNIDQRAAAESAEAKASGMECGHVAPEVLNARAPGGISSPCEPPAAAVSDQRCARRPAPDATCPNEATGALRVVMKPAETVEKRWGRTSLMTFVMDLPLCPSCFALTSIFDCTGQDLRSALGKTAQRMNEGILTDWSRAKLEHVPFDDPQYVLLRKSRTPAEG